MRVFHREAAATAGDRAQIRRVGEQLAHRRLGLDDLILALGVDAQDAATALVDVADHVARALFGDGDFEIHHRFEEDRLGRQEGLFEALGAGHLEAEVAGVHVVELAVDELDLDVDHGEAGVDAFDHGAADALVDRGDEVARDGAAHDLVDELVAEAPVGFEVDDADAELAATARLLLVLAFDVPDAALDRLAVGDLGGQEVDVDRVFAAQALDGDLDVGLANARDQCLAGFHVAADLQGRVLVGEATERVGDAILVLLGLGLERVGDDRLDLGQIGQERGGFCLAERVAGGGVLELGDDGDVTSHSLRHDLGLLALERDELGVALVRALAGVEQLAVARKCPRPDAHHRELADKLIDHCLEDLGRERRGRIAGALDRVAGARIGGLFGRVIEGRRAAGDDEAERVADADVLQARGTQQRKNFGGGDGLGEALAQVVFGEVAVFEVFFGERVIGRGHGVDEELVVHLGLVHEVGRDGLFDNGAVLVLGAARLHRDEIDDAAESRLLAEGQLDGRHLGGERFPDVGQGAFEVGALAVELVEDDHARQVLLIGEAPDAVRLNLNAISGADEHRGQVDGCQAGAHVHREVGIARRVEDVDLASVPLARAEVEPDGSLPLDLFRLGVELA